MLDRIFCGKDVPKNLDGWPELRPFGHGCTRRLMNVNGRLSAPIGAPLTWPEKMLDGVLPGVTVKKKLKDTPVIMLTAAADLGSVVKANEYGVQDYIKKPFLPDELADRVAKVIWDNWQQQGVGGRPRNPENRPIYEEF